MNKDKKIDRILNSREWIDKTFKGIYINNKHPFKVRCKKCKSIIDLKDVSHIFTRDIYLECPICSSKFKEFEDRKPTCEVCNKLLTYEQYKERGIFCSIKCSNISRVGNSPYLIIKNRLTDDYLAYLQNEVCFRNIGELKRFLNIENSMSKNTRELFNKKITDFNFEFKDKNYIDKDTIIEVFKLNMNMTESAKYLNVSYDILKKNAKNFKIWSDEFNNDKIRNIKSNKEFFINNILVKNSKSSTAYVKKCLLKYNIKNYICEECGRKLWNGRDIPLDLHHIDGDNRNNQIENLKLLCPNCHRQTDNFGSLNKKKIKAL